MIPVLVFLENWGKSGKLDPIVQNNGHQYTESHPHFTLNEALLKYKGHLLGKVIPVFVYLWNWDKSVKLGLNNPN